MRRGWGTLLAIAMLVAGCSGSGGDTTDTRSTAVGPTDGVAATPADASIEELLAVMPVPALVDGGAALGCERWGYACNPLSAPDDVLDRTKAASDLVVAAMHASDDAREQLRLGLLALTGIDGVGHVEADVAYATMLGFTIDAGPQMTILTVAGELQEGGEVAPDDDTFELAPETAPDPDLLQSFTGAVTRDVSVRVRPQRYEPAGGPATTRRAAIFNPFDWDSASEIAAIFQAEDEYTTVDVFEGDSVTPWTVTNVRDYDAVHIITHGGGSCPSWTNDRRECSSTFIGSEFDADAMVKWMAEASSNANVPFSMCEMKETKTIHYCFRSEGFPANPDGIVFFGSCGSDAGFNTTGAGASIGWTGTSQQFVVERTARKFWELMVTDGVEFELAKTLIQGGGYDNHAITYWASSGAVKMYTEAAFQGRNLRARDVVELRIDGAEPRGQVVQFRGQPADGKPEMIPTKGQELTFTVEGVRLGSESKVQIQLFGDGVEWKSDIDLARDGTVIEQNNGYATWQVTLRPESVQIPDVTWADLSPERAPIELEIRAFENASEYTAHRGTVRLGTDIEFSGPLPIFEELAAGLPADGDVRGNDLRVHINTATGELTGTMMVEMWGYGRRLGSWQYELTGTYDPTSGAVHGELSAKSEGGAVGVHVGDKGGGSSQGQVELATESLEMLLDIDGQSQVYAGTVVR